MKPNRPLIVLVGNPNTGKTTLFNSLSRSRQKTGNYPGTTIEKKIGQCELASNKKLQLLDLPGLYSLQATSYDEKISRDALLGKLTGLPKPDLLLFVLDATNLRRNLFLFSQITELGLPMIVALTMYDQIQRTKNKHFTVSSLEKSLGVPVVPVIAYRPESSVGIKDALDKALQKMPFPTPFHSDSKEQQAIIKNIHDELHSHSKLSLFEVREYLSQDIDTSSMRIPTEYVKRLEDAKSQYAKLLQKNPASISLSRYRWIDSIWKRVQKHERNSQSSSHGQWDRILTHRFFGLLIFGAIMCFMFQSIYTFAEPVMMWIEGSLNFLGNHLGALFVNSPFWGSLVKDGVIGGVGAVLTFLPQIAILFSFIAILEDSGYLVRASFLMDRLLSWSGLNGRAFIPLLSSFACAIPGILSTRVMPENRVRISTILIAPLVSCSARLPIYLLLIGAFIEPQFGPFIAGLCLFFMHSIGLMIALPLVWFFHRGILRNVPNTSFLMEFPPYRKPRLYNITLRVYEATKKFIVKAGTVIFCFSIIIWILAYFPQKPLLPANPIEQQNQLEYSYLGRMGKTLAPLFAPLGFDWKISVGILSAFPAREVFISTLGIIYQVDDTSEEKIDLRKKLSYERDTEGKLVYTPLLALSVMIFFALCSQCMGTLAVIRKELGKWRWAVFVFVYMTGLAYLFSFLTYQCGKLLGFA